MEKETYISDLQDHISELSGKDKLEAITNWINKNLQIQACFCKIYGKRWSYYAGFIDQTDLQTQIRLNEDWGIILNGSDFNADYWEDFFSFIKKALPNKSLP